MPNYATHEVFSLLATHYKGKGLHARSVALARTTRDLAELCLRAAVPTASKPLHLAMLLLTADYVSDPEIGHADLARAGTLLEWGSLLAILHTPEGQTAPEFATVKAQAIGLTRDERESAALTWSAIAAALDALPEQDDRTEAMRDRFAFEADRLRSDAGLSDLLDRLAVTDHSALALLYRAFEKRQLDRWVYPSVDEQAAAERLADPSLVALVEIRQETETKRSTITITPAGERLIVELGVARRLLPDGAEAWLPLAQHKAVWSAWQFWAPRLTARGLSIASCDADEEHSGLELELRSVHDPLHEGVHVEIDVFGRTSDDNGQLAGDPDIGPNELARLVDDCLHVSDEQAQQVRRAVATLIAAPFSAPSLGEAMYAAYCESSGGKNYQGFPCPEWLSLPAAIRGHWGAAARACKILLLGLDEG